MTGIKKVGGYIDIFNSTDDFHQRLKNFVRDKEAFSPNTWKQLLSVMRVSYRWATDNGRNFLPMSSDDLRDYLMYLQQNNRASSTIAQHAAMISMLHRNAGFVPPNTSPDVARAIKKINRTAVVSGERAGQAVPFRKTDLMAIDKIWQNSPRLMELRDLAFLHLAYSTLLRISEVARIRVRDLTRTDDGLFIIDVGFTKTIVQSSGIIKALSERSSARMDEWLKAAGLYDKPDSFIFCRIHRSNKALPNDHTEFSTRSLEEVFERAWRATGNEDIVKTNKNRYAGWSGHSARVGAAQDMTQSGFSLAEIMHEGTWTKSETVMRYIRNLEAHKGAMMKLMKDE